MTRFLPSVAPKFAAFCVAAIVAVAALPSAAGAADAPTAAIRTSGNATAGAERALKPVGTNGTVRAGDLVVLGGASDFAFVDFGGGTSVSLVGPATLRIVEITPVGTRVRLESGAISEVSAGAVAIEVQTPAGPSLVLQNATGSARMAAQDKVVLEKRSGVFGRVYNGGTGQDLGASPWVMNLRTGAAGAMESTGPRVARTPAVRGKVENLPGDRARILLGDRVITWEPASGFCPTEGADGGIKLCFCSKGEEWGVVYVGTDTVLFLAKDQCVTFDAQGGVTSFDGIVHMYHPFEENWDEPVENAADASVSYTSRR